MRKILFATMAILLMFAFVACEEEGEVKAVAKKVTITAAGSATSIAKGATLQFSAVVTGDNKPAQTVTWTAVANPQTGVSISNTGLLTVGATATATSVAVTATSTVTKTVKSDPMTITISSGSGGTAPTSITVTAAGDADTLFIGGTLQLSATVLPAGAVQTVVWSISGTAPGVTINETSGLLTAAANATANTVTARATSTENTVNGSITLFVAAQQSGPAEDGGKDAMANAHFTRTGTKVWSMADWIVDRASFGNGAKPVINSGAASVKTIVNNGINIKGMGAAHDSIDLKLSGPNGADGVIITDNKYKITIIGVVLGFSDTQAGLTTDGGTYDYVEDPINVSGDDEIFVLEYETNWDYASTGVRIFVGAKGATSFPDIRITLMEIEEMSQFKACECNSAMSGGSCDMNGKRISEGGAIGCTCNPTGAACDHACYVCLKVGRAYAPPNEDTTVPYIVPADEANAFYLDLNDAKYYNNVGAQSTKRPIIVSAADKVTYTFNEDTQLLWLKLSDAQKAKMKAAQNTLIEIVGTATNDASFRYTLAKQASAGWGFHTMNGPGAFSTLLSGRLTVAGALNDEAEYLAIQHRVAANTDLVIQSIRITCDPVTYVVPTAGVGEMYLNLADCDYQMGGNYPVPRRPMALTAADKVTYDFTTRSVRQTLFIKLSETQVTAILAAAVPPTITVVGTCVPDCDLRILLGNTDGGSWNATTTSGLGAMGKLSTKTGAFVWAGESEKERTGYLIIGMESNAGTNPAENVKLELTSIKLDISGAPPPPSCAFCGVLESTGCTCDILTGNLPAPFQRAGSPVVAIVEDGLGIRTGANWEGVDFKLAVQEGDKLTIAATTNGTGTAELMLQIASTGSAEEQSLFLGAFPVEDEEIEIDADAATKIAAYEGGAIRIRFGATPTPARMVITKLTLVRDDETIFDLEEWIEEQAE